MSELRYPNESQAYREAREALLKEEQELVAKVNANEPGCKLYALHRNEAAGTYVFMERYTDQAAVEAHRATDYFKALGRKMGEYMDGRADVVRLTEI